MDPYIAYTTRGALRICGYGPTREAAAAAGWERGLDAVDPTERAACEIHRSRDGALRAFCSLPGKRADWSAIVETVEAAASGALADYEGDDEIPYEAREFARKARAGLI